MNKKMFVDFISEKTGRTKKDSAEFLDVVLESIQEVVETEGKLALAGFGNFEKKDIKGRKGVSKLQGVEKTWETEDSCGVRFKTAKAFVDRLNN